MSAPPPEARAVATGGDSGPAPRAVAQAIEPQPAAATPEPSTPEPARARPAPSTPESARARPAETSVRLSTTKLDTLMEMVGELQAARLSAELRQTELRSLLASAEGLEALSRAVRQQARRLRLAAANGGAKSGANAGANAGAASGAHGGATSGAHS